eukprot:697302-Prorocentrum_minimum.AAC.1
MKCSRPPPLTPLHNQQSLPHVRDDNPHVRCAVQRNRHATTFGTFGHSALMGALTWEGITPSPSAMAATNGTVWKAEGEATSPSRRVTRRG